MTWLDNKAWTTMQTQGSDNKHKNMDETVILIPRAILHRNLYTRKDQEMCFETHLCHKKRSTTREVVDDAACTWFGQIPAGGQII